MKTCIIINPEAGSAERMHLLEDELEAQGVPCWNTAAPGDEQRLTQNAIDDGFDRLVVAGGDGTISAVVNTLMEADADIELGVFPMGTGNDLARTLVLPQEPGEALRLALEGATCPLDLFRVDGAAQGPVYGINASAGGFSGQVNEELTPEMKKTWGPLAFMLSAAQALPDLHAYETHLTFDDEPPEEIDVLNIVVANGRTVAGGRMVAPQADPTDGLLDVMVVQQGTLLELSEVAARLLAGEIGESQVVAYRQVQRLHVESRPGMWFNVDGELLTKKPLTFTVLPGALPVVCGYGFGA